MAIYSLAGRAKKYDGSTIDYVSIFKWTDGTCIAQIKPDAAGNWAYRDTQQKVVGVTYVADGCEPITHGSYTSQLDKSMYRWWRISNIVNREQTSPEYGQSVAELVFVTEQGVLSNNQNNAFSNGSYVDINSTPETYNAAKAFDGNINTLSAAPQQSTSQPLFWKIGYRFDVDVTVSAIKIRPRQDAGYGQEWQTADIEASDDGINWFKYGSIAPMIAAESKALTTTVITVY